MLCTTHCPATHLMKRFLFCVIGIFLFACASAQMSYSVDTSQAEIKESVLFLTGYLNEFKNEKLPDLTRYWSEQDCKRSKLPDDMMYSISTDEVTYNFVRRQTVFYAKVYKGYVHLKTLFATTDSSANTTVCAITNHYVQVGSKPCFISELELHKDFYTEKQVGNIRYHYPKTHVFSQAKANALVDKLKRIEKEWGFKPVKLDYYFADSHEALTHMRGMDYCYGMNEADPSGMSFPETNTIFCHGLGEDYLHEILHLYFNPLYVKSPVCHGLVYYLAGGLGHDFDWMIRRMDQYLRTYPDLDLTGYQDMHMQSKDKMLHIDHVINGLLCKMVYEKSGIPGLKRILAYKTTDEIFEKEFGIAPKDKNTFLRAKFALYAKPR